jgi:hypothetical protein
MSLKPRCSRARGFCGVFSISDNILENITMPKRRSHMNRHGLLYVVLVVWILVCAYAAFAQQQGLATKGDETKVTIKGTILYMERTGGYMVRGEEPPEEFLIENADAKILGDIAKEGKTVIVEGRTPQGADMLIIEKLDGKHYPSPKCAD